MTARAATWAEADALVAWVQAWEPVRVVPADALVERAGHLRQLAPAPVRSGLRLVKEDESS